MTVSIVLVTNTLTEHILWLLALCLILGRGFGIGLHIRTSGTGLEVARIPASKTAGFDVAKCTGLEMVEVFVEIDASASNVVKKVSSLGTATSGLDTVGTSDLDARVSGTNTSVLDAQNVPGWDGCRSSCSAMRSRSDSDLLLSKEPNFTSSLALSHAPST